MALIYNAPIEGKKSTIDGNSSSDQMRTFYWIKKALIEAKKKQFFMPLASVQNLPKHYGKTVKAYHYLPLLDDRNVNDQGIDATGVEIKDGNLYGSSKDVGTILGKIPSLTEKGGRVNRVGFSRQQIEGSIVEAGFFFEFTRESLDFDSDDTLMEHLARETINAATEITEDLLQIDLLNAAGVVVFAGAATKDEEVTGEEQDIGGIQMPISEVTYENLMRLDTTLTNNRTDQHTTIITGSTKIDTKTIPSSRIMYVGSELKATLRRMTDLFGNQAFIPAHHYADAGNLLNGEIGSIDSFRIIEVPGMLNWEAKGAEVTDNPGYRTGMDENDVERYNIYPMLVVGNESFATIGFQTGGESVKFDINTVMPGKQTAGYHDPYGKTGFSSIQWYYGTLIKRPERIGLIKTVAPI